MSRIEIHELVYMLQKQDQQAQILFVEGVRDVAFWEQIVPTAERSAVSVYPIDRVAVEGVEGGCKGRAMRLAEILTEQNINGRALFFLDSDEMNVTGGVVPENVILTDFRDLEGYAITEPCVSMMLYSLGKNPEVSNVVFESCCEASKDIGVLRLADFLSGFSFSFKSAFAKHPGRVLTRAEGGCSLSVPGLIDRLFQISGADAEQRALYNAERENAVAISAEFDRIQFVRGKDFISVLSYYLNEAFDFCQSLLSMHLVHSIDSYRNQPRFSRIEGFLRQ